MDKIPRSIIDNYSEEIVEERIDWLKKKTELELSGITEYSISPQDTRGNIENFIGIAQVPVGLAGPLRINGDHAKDYFFIPLATTEGALVASYNRGMKIISESGGANPRLLKDETYIGAIIEFNDLSEVIEFFNWIDDSFNKLKEIAESTTKHGKLRHIEKIPQGKRVLLNFYYTTGDASGLNMITVATKAIIDNIMEKTKAQKYILPVTFNDKKATSMNVVKGRGKKVSADVVIPRKIVEEALRTTPEEMSHSCYSNYLMAGANIGTITYNHHFANGLAALFIACGQDVAYVAESSVGCTIMDTTEDGDLYVSVNLPDLIIATVGGGTGLGTAKEYLELIGCYGVGKVKKFAEIIAAVLLAGEISIWGSIVSGEFSEAHDRYGRNR
ncbi:MAG: hydroxymethylglutaryl-CoA reductase [Euryarchaeota archaeon]|nr:hydroxymethylglutaryl-CoA reductase [Euryarchaeota archaeon]